VIYHVTLTHLFSAEETRPAKLRFVRYILLICVKTVVLAGLGYD